MDTYLTIAYFSIRRTYLLRFGTDLPANIAIKEARNALARLIVQLSGF
jgi:hypothetical protein